MAISGIWTKSSYSGGNNNCVEVSKVFATDPQVLVRDSKDPNGGHLAFTGAAWGCFISAIRSEAFTS